MDRATQNPSALILLQTGRDESAGTVGALLSRVAFGYDGGEVGAAPTAGLVTREETWLDTTNTNVMTATRAYDDWGNATSVSDASGATTTTVFDGAQHLFAVSATNAANETVSTAWDVGCGAPTQTTDANGQLTTVTLDAFCRTLRTDGPLGSFQEISYKDQGSAGSQRVQSENAVAHRRRGQQRGARVPRRLRSHVAHGRGRTDSGPRDHQRSDVHSPRRAGLAHSLGRLLSRADPDSGTWTFGYDVAARKSTQTDAKGQTTEEWRDAAGRVMQRRTTDEAGRAETVAFTYGEPRAGFFNVGRLTTMTDAHGSARYDYDALGRQVRLRRMLDGIESVLTQRFDAAGRLLGTTFPDGDAFGTPASPLQYDAAGRLASVPGLVSGAAYDAAGRPHSATFANGVATAWDHHDRGWLSSVRTTRGSVVLQDFTYSFDVSGQTTDIVSPDPARTWSYAYDALGRLVTAER